VWWAVPDGTSTDTGTDSDPGTPEEQINSTVTSVSLFDAVASAMAPVLGLLGASTPAHQIGGGGGGGAYMFASLDELDGVITQWQGLIDELKADQRRVNHAVENLARPAGDDVSQENFRESNKVVLAMQRHNEELMKYAAHYVTKLQECRKQMATTEEGNQTAMNQVH
jgi:hypothetical protein